MCLTQAAGNKVSKDAIHNWFFVVCCMLARAGLEMNEKAANVRRTTLKDIRMPGELVLTHYHSIYACIYYI